MLSRELAEIKRVCFFGSLAAVCLVGCAKTVKPKLVTPPTPVSSTRVQHEGNLDPDEKTASFSVPPEQLAALLIQTAEQEGWLPGRKATVYEGSWTVNVKNPDRTQGKTKGGREKKIAIQESPAGGSSVRIGNGRVSLPPELLAPLTSNVQAHLTRPRGRTGFLRNTVSHILVTVGPASRPHRELGEVHADTLGEAQARQSLTDRLLALPFSSDADAAEPMASREEMYARLREEAFTLYGTRVDAVINATYRTLSNGDVMASGIAVQFIRLEDRLDELRHLHDKGYLSDEEYERRRSEILDEI